MRIVTILLALLLVTLTGCASQTQVTPTWPALDVIELSDGGVCLSPDSAMKLAEYRALLESLR